MQIIKKEIDEALSSKDYDRFKQIVQGTSVKALLFILQEKQRFKCFVKKHDLSFISKVFNYLDTINEHEKYKNKDLIEELRTRSTATEFEIESVFHSHQGKQQHYKAFIDLGKGVKAQQIDSFKHRTICHVLTEKLNMDKSFMEQALSIINHHKLLDKTMVSRLGIAALQSDFQLLTNYLFKSQIFSNEPLKYHYLDYVFTHTQNIKQLDYLMDNFEKEIRQIFFNKIDNNDFWHDFKNKFGSKQYGTDYAPITQLTAREPNVEKLIWLEQHHMGYSNIELPFYINFMKHLPLKQIEKILENVNTYKYLNMFDKSIKEFEELPERFRTGEYWRRISQKVDDQKTELLNQLNYASNGINEFSKENLYGELKAIMLKANLSMFLPQQKNIVRSRKV